MFLNTLKEYYQNNDNIDEKDLNDENDNEFLIVEKEQDFSTIINNVDNLFKSKSIKIKLKTYTTFGVEYILAKPYPDIVNILNSLNSANVKFIKFMIKNNKNIFIMNPN